MSAKKAARPSTPKPGTGAKQANRSASRGAARERAARMREQQRRAERRRRSLIQAGAVVAVLALTVGIGIAVQAQRNSAKGPAGTPRGVVDGTGFAAGPATAKATVVLYEDFQCPVCRDFEHTTGPTLQKLVDPGTARVVYRPIAFLDRASTTRYSTRALNAAGCVTDSGGAFPKMHDLLYANQPAEGSAGLPDDKLIDLGHQAGASGDTFSSCAHKLRYQAWTRQVTDAASKDGVNATPTVRVNGTTLSQPTPANLTAAVQAATRS